MMLKAFLLATTMTVGLEYHAMIGLFFLCACYELHREAVLGGPGRSRAHPKRGIFLSEDEDERSVDRDQMGKLERRCL